MILPNSVTGRDEINELDEIHLLILKIVGRPSSSAHHSQSDSQQAVEKTPSMEAVYADGNL